jgi:MFS family permease
MTGSARGLGGVFLGFGVPMLLLTPFGGVAADRLPKRTVLVVAEAALVVSALGVGVADVLDVLRYWMLVASAGIQGAAFAVFGPTRVAMTGEVVPSHLMANAMVLTQMSLNGTRVFAPAAAGALIGVAFVGTAGVYLITAAFTVAALVVTLRLPPVPRRTDRPPRSVLGELGDGVRYVHRRPSLRLLVAVSYVIVIVGFPYIAFLPVMAQDVFDAGVSGFGVMSSASAVGALVAMIWIAKRARASDVWRLQASGAVVFGLALALFGLAPTYVLALVTLVVLGGAASAFQAMNNTLILAESDLEYHGRVQSLVTLGFSGFGMAALPLGAIADVAGLRATHTAMGVICLVASLLYIVGRARLARRQTVLDV